MEKFHHAIQGIGSRKVTLRVPPGIYRINPSGKRTYTIPPNVTLKIELGAILEPVKEKTLNIAGHIKAGPYCIFGGLGNVVLSDNNFQGVYPQWWGAKANGKDDDTIPFIKALTAVKGKAKLVLPRGTYRLGVTKGLFSQLSGDLFIEGKEGAVLTVDSYTWSISSPKVSQPKLTASAHRGQTFLSVDDSKGIKYGDLIHIISGEVGETAWKTPKHDISVVAGVRNGKFIILSNPLNFSYAPKEAGLEVRVYRPRGLTFTNLTFKPNIAGSAIDLKYLRNVSITNCQITGSGLQVTHQTGIRTQGCVDVVVRDIVMEHIYYGIAPCFTRNFLAENTNSSFCRHPYTPAAFSDNVVIRNLYGWQNEATMDSHPAFNVHYDNVRAYDGLNQGVSCLRCVGGKITNSYFYNPLTKGAGRFHTVALADMALYRDYTFQAENVVWDTPNAAPGQLLFGPLYGGKAYLKKVQAKHINVSYEVVNQVGEAILEDCEYEKLYCRNRNTMVRWPNRQNIDALWEKDNQRFLIDPRKEALFRSNNAAFLRGAIFTGVVGDSITKRLKIKTFINLYPGGGSVLTDGILKLKGTINLGDGNSSESAEQCFRFKHHYVATSWVKITKLDGQSNVSLSAISPQQFLTLDVGDIFQKGASETQNQNVDEWGVDFTVRLSSKYKNARNDLYYELELSSPEYKKP